MSELDCLNSILAENLNGNCQPLKALAKCQEFVLFKEVAQLLARIALENFYFIFFPPVESFGLNCCDSPSLEAVHNMTIQQRVDA